MQNRFAFFFNISKKYTIVDLVVSRTIYFFPASFQYTQISIAKKVYRERCGQNRIKSIDDILLYLKNFDPLMYNLILKNESTNFLFQISFLNVFSKKCNKSFQCLILNCSTFVNRKQIELDIACWSCIGFFFSEAFCSLYKFTNRLRLFLSSHIVWKILCL